MKTSTPSTPRKILIHNHQSPGDILVLTGTVRDIKLAHPEIEVAVKTTAMELWYNNPHISIPSKDSEIVLAEYPLIHKSNAVSSHFTEGFRLFFEDKLKLDIPQTSFKPDVHFLPDEKSKVEGKYWVIMAGGKFDFTAKWWHFNDYQKVVDHFKGKIKFVQCGEKNHWHKPLSGVVDMLGKTNTREYMNVVNQSQGVLTPVSFGMHMAAACDKACVVIAGGREPASWEQYSNHRFLDTCGALDCCKFGGCWKSRCHQVGDGDEKDLEKNLCVNRVKREQDVYIPKCMDMIKPKHVIEAIEMYYEGGALCY